MSAAGGLFAAFKSLGEVCSDDVAISVRYKGGGQRRGPVVLAAVSNVVHQYNARSLRLTTVSEPLGERVTCVAADRTITFAGMRDGDVHALRNNRQIMRTYSGEHTSAIVRLLPFGDHLISLERANALVVWDTHCGEPHCRIEFDADTFEASALCHPSTFVNKILLGSRQGELRMVNVKTAKTVHVYESAFGAPVTCLQQSPAIAVVAVGLLDGRCVLHNVDADQAIFSVRQDWGAVDCVAFRMDSVATMVTGGGGAGHLAVWELDKRQLIGQLSDAHEAAVTGLCALPGEPIVVSSGADNCIKTWIFDMNDGLARQLAVRDGPGRQSTLARFVDATGEMLVSASDDGRLRMFSTVKDTKQQSLGAAGTMQRSVAKKRKIDLQKIGLPPPCRLSVSLGRESSWDNVMCAHVGRVDVTTWSTRLCKLGKHHMTHKRFQVGGKWPKAAVTDVCVTHCGNFALIAYTSGHVDVWNMQSGLHRGSLADPKLKGLAHSCAVSGVSSDALNVRAMSADSSGRLKIWWFGKRTLCASVHLTPDDSVGLIRLAFNRANDLLAAADSKGTIYIADVECGRVVRKFVCSTVHAVSISDVTFNHSGDWLLCTDATDRALRVWHMPTGRLIDAVTFDTECTAMAFSPSGQFLATCHKGQRGVFLWANRTVFDSDVSTGRALADDYLPGATRSLPNSRPIEEGATTAAGANGNEGDNANADGASQVCRDVNMEQWHSDADEGQVSQLGEALATLSGLAQPRWANLPQLDEIRKRNKPKEAVRKPQRAPFFLPTVSTLDDFVFDANAIDNAQGGASSAECSSRVLQRKRALLEPGTKWSRSLCAADTGERRRGALDKLKLMGPSAIDNELRLMLVADEQCEQVSTLARHFVLMLQEALATGVDFELAHAYLATWLKIHFGSIAKMKDAEFVELLHKTRECAVSGWRRLDDTLIECVSVVQWLKSAAI